MPVCGLQNSRQKIGVCIMRMDKEILRRTQAQFLMDCALSPDCAGTGQGYLIGRKPEMPEQDFMTDISYGYLMRDYMEAYRETAFAGKDYGIVSRARVYQGMDLFFRAILFCGKGYLLADDAIYDWCCREYREGGIRPEWFCRFSNLRRLDQQLGRYRRRIADTHIYFLPGGEEEAPLTPSVEVRWFEQDEIAGWKEGTAFRHAICGSELMPDKIAAAAVLDGKTVAVAGASEDSPLLWQIGIDVLPSCEGMGLASGLVSLLKKEILRRGKIPFYGTSESHGVSRNVAVRAGFLPAWAEVYVQK